MLPAQTKQQEMRRWQIEAALAYAEANAWHFLARVTPGGGKTYWALRVIQAELCRGTVERVVIVVSSLGIKKQWMDDFEEHLGLKLVDYNAYEPGGYGFITTYQQVANESAAETFSKYCEQFKVFAVFDEVHHASDKNTWGGRLRDAFQGAARILSLTGTPFRTDGKPVPFVNYKNDECQPDYSFVYPQALADNIVRSLRFVFYDGPSSWRREGAEAQEKVLSLAGQDDLPATLAASLDPSGNFARAMIAGAHEELLAMPAGSAGLLIAKDVKHADSLAVLLKEVTGVDPMVVHSGPTSSGAVSKIRKFRNSSDQWLISVKMVSEGVDIPRIRVVCWMTNYKTQLFFEQLIARGLRGNRDEVCVVVMPELPSLVAMSYAVTDALIPGLKEDDDDDQWPKKKGGFSKKSTSIEFLGSEGYLSKTFVPTESPHTTDPIASFCIAQRKQRSALEQARYHSDDVYRSRALERAKSEEYRQKQRQSRKARYKEDPEYREKILKRNQQRMAQDPLLAQKNVEYQKRLRESPEYKAYKAKLMKDRYRNDPDFRLKKIEYNKRRYQAKKLAKQQASEQQTPSAQ